MSRGKKLHSQAIEAREKEQNFLKSLNLADEAFIESSSENDYVEMAGALGTRANNLTHLFQKTKNKAFLILAKFTSEAEVEIAKLTNIAGNVGRAQFDLGKIYEKLEDFQNAVTNFEKAVETKLPKDHNRPAVLADMKAHLAYAKYKSGDKSGLDLMIEAIAELENSDEEKYNKDVWLSGARMRAAEMLKKDNLELAKEHLKKAKEIIDANSELVLRKEQWEKLASNLLL